MSFIKPTDVAQARTAVINGIGLAFGVMLLYLVFEKISPRLAGRLGIAMGETPG